MKRKRYQGVTHKHFKRELFIERPLCLIMAVALIIGFLYFELSPFLCSLAILYLLMVITFSIGQFILLYKEEYLIGKDTLTICKIGKKEEVVLPTSLTVVIALADIKMPFGSFFKKEDSWQRVSSGHVGGTIKLIEDKCSVTLLSNTSLQDFLSFAHREKWGSHARDYYQLKKNKRNPQYSNTIIEHRIELLGDPNNYIYSFFYDQSVLDDLLANRDCLVIIPESLWGKVQINSDKARIYIDKGY